MLSQAPLLITQHLDVECWKDLDMLRPTDILAGGCLACSSMSGSENNLCGGDGSHYLWGRFCHFWNPLKIVIHNPTRCSLSTRYIPGRAMSTRNTKISKPWFLPATALFSMWALLLSYCGFIHRFIHHLFNNHTLIALTSPVLAFHSNLLSLKPLFIVSPLLHKSAFRTSVFPHHKVRNPLVHPWPP